LASLATAALGVYLSIRVLAALYRIADLWYRIGTDWPRVAGRIAAWGGAALLIALAAGHRRAAFVWGFVSYAVFHALLHVATRGYVRRRVDARRRAF
jgi:hypothetical protein